MDQHEMRQVEVYKLAGRLLHMLLNLILGIWITLSKSQKSRGFGMPSVLDKTHLDGAFPGSVDFSLPLFDAGYEPSPSTRVSGRSL